jgi:hypothetical protein
MRCVICSCDFRVDEGIACTASHFFCDIDFETFVRSECAQVDVTLLKHKYGQIHCPLMNSDSQCRANPFSNRDLARHVTDDTFAMYMLSRERIMSHNARDKWQRMTQEELDRIIQELQALGLSPPLASSHTDHHDMQAAMATDPDELAGDSGGDFRVDDDGAYARFSAASGAPLRHTAHRWSKFDTERWRGLRRGDGGDGGGGDDGGHDGGGHDGSHGGGGHGGGGHGGGHDGGGHDGSGGPDGAGGARSTHGSDGSGSDSEWPPARRSAREGLAAPAPAARRRDADARGEQGPAER